MEGFFSDLGKLKNQFSKYLVNTSAEVLKYVSAESHKPQFYQTIHCLTIDLLAILMNDSKTQPLPQDVKNLAKKLCADLSQQMEDFDKDIAKYKKSDHKKIEREYIKNCYNLLYTTAPKLTAAPDLWNQVAATLNAFTQWLGDFDIIPEKWITRTPFFTVHHKAKIELSEELSKIECSLKS